MPHRLCWRLVTVCVVGVLSLLSASRLRRLVVEVVGVGVSLLLLLRRCRQRRPFLWLCLSASAPRRWRRLVVVAEGGVSAFSEKLSLY